MNRTASIRRLLALAILAALLAPVSRAAAQYQRPDGARGLPREHDYQRAILDWWATLTEKDFDVENPPLKVEESADAEHRMRLWVLSLDFPRIGNKRSAPSTYIRGDQFVLRFVESPADSTVIRPGAWAEPITWLANFDDPNNPYFKSRPLKLRAFVIAAQDIMLIDEQHEHQSDKPMWKRADWLGPRLCFWAYVYRGTKDALPDNVRKAYESALKKMITRSAAWGPKGEETFFDISLVTGMVIAAKTMNDDETTQRVEAYARRLFEPGAFYNAAGYFADQGTFDTGFNGFSLYFATWAAAESDWAWMKANVAQAWKLRGHLQLPEPDHKPHATWGTVNTRVSPTHTTLRTASHVIDDQWNWGYKPVTACYLTDEAFCQVRWPSDVEFKGATQAAFSGMGHDLGETAKILEKKRKDEPYQSRPWTYQLWPEHQNFPMQNFGYDCFPKGFYKHYADARLKKPDLFKLPFDRDAAFTERFADAYLIAKTPGTFANPKPRTYGVVIHTGPVGAYPGGEMLEFTNAPYGLGGGTLSAFWTPATGSILLGSRGGMFAPGGQPKVYDDPEQWRDWPVHAVIGTTDGKSFFTSARIANPLPTYDVAKDHATVRVTGVIPAVPLHRGPPALKGRLTMSRTFTYATDGLRVETAVTGDGADSVAELYEAIPVFHRDEMSQAKTVATKIEFNAGGKWLAAFTPEAPPPPAKKGAAPEPVARPAAPAPQYFEQVTAIRLSRFEGAVVITFDKPRRVKLSPSDARGGFLTGHVSRNLLVDLLDNKDQPAAVTNQRTVAYTIVPAAR